MLYEPYLSSALTLAQRCAERIEYRLKIVGEAAMTPKNFTARSLLLQGFGELTLPILQLLG